MVSLCGIDADSPSSACMGPLAGCMAHPGWELLGRAHTALVCSVALLGGMGYGEKQRGKEHTL